MTEDDILDWCTNCNVTIMVDVGDSGRYFIFARTDSAVSRLFEGKKVDDLLYPGEILCYLYEVSDKNSTVEFRLQLYSGLISQEIYPNDPSPLLKNSSMVMNGTKSSSIFYLSAEDRMFFNTTLNEFKYCLFAHMTTSYSLLINEFKSSSKLYSTLIDGFDENNLVHSSDLLFYLYEVPPLRYFYEDIILDFQL